MQQLCSLAKESRGLALVCFFTLYGGWLRDPNMRSVRECSTQAAHKIQYTRALTEKPYTADPKALARTKPTGASGQQGLQQCATRLKL